MAKITCPVCGEPQKIYNGKIVRHDGVGPITCTGSGSELYTFTMTKKRADELGLIICECGYPENNHFEFGDRPCAHNKDCKKFRPRGRHGITMNKLKGD